MRIPGLVVQASPCVVLILVSSETAHRLKPVLLFRLERSFYPKCGSTSRKTRLLQHLCYLPRRTKQFKLRLLARIVRVEEREPFIIFVEVRRFQVFQGAASLIELHLQNAQTFLRELQLEACHISRKIGFAYLSRLAANFERKLTTFFRELQFCGTQVGSRECDCRRCAGGE